MPTRFEQHLRRTVVPNLVRQFGESAEYFPCNGESRPIEVLVIRDPLSIASEVGEVLVNALVVRVKNASDGITADELDTGGDKLLIALRSGGDTSLRSIVQLLSDANGFLRLLVQ
jgi:hypothetical protein